MDGITRKKRQEIKEFFKRHFVQITLPTIWRINEKLAKHTGIIPVWYDCCINSCMAFTGPSADDDHCTAPKYRSKPNGPRCNEARYYPGTTRSRKKWLYIPLLQRLVKQFGSEQARVLTEYRASFDSKSCSDLTDIFDGELYQELRTLKGLFTR
jgi:hypothetical protein